MKVKFDPYIATISAFLSLFGVLMIYSASSYGALYDYGDAFFTLKNNY